MGGDALREAGVLVVVFYAVGEFLSDAHGLGVWAVPRAGALA
jgi:hypothetical protein